jgi:thiamine monophosphate kinase
VAAELGVDPGSFAASAGEDYELCVCLPGDRAGPPLTVVGSVVQGESGLVFVDSPNEISGFEHSL